LGDFERNVFGLCEFVLARTSRLDPLPILWSLLAPSLLLAKFTRSQKDDLRISSVTAD